MKRARKPNPIFQYYHNIEKMDKDKIIDENETIEYKICPNCDSKIEKKTHFCPLCFEFQHDNMEFRLCNHCNRATEFGSKYCRHCGR